MMLAISVVRVILTLVGKTLVGIDRLFDPTDQLGSTSGRYYFWTSLQIAIADTGRPTASVNKFIE